MTRLEADSYSAHLRRESTRFRDVLALTPSGVRVPTCPDWDADDLLWHLAEVQWFWGEVVAARPAGPPEQHPQRPASRAALLAFFDEVSARLCDLLGTVAPDEPAWSWADEQTVGFT
ncbi:MAG: maleylpyruvate isomerase N-terminal domain-containing protein, partial [Actinobacteria bacterium]|nr:maleylpyruvate isomerase N-terminal domain-containing protein [Actinomycetota bacterium]